jgi:alpha-galactosidase
MIGNRVRRNGLSYAIGGSAVLLIVGSGLAQQRTAARPSEGERGLQVEVNAADGRYSIGLAGANAVALSAGVGVEVDGRWLHAGDYPRHAVEHSQVEGELGPATEWQVTYSGVDAQPDLIYYLRSYTDVPAGDIQVIVRNTTRQTIHVEAIRSVDATKGSVLDLDGPPADDRVLSDSFSEDRPAITIQNLGAAEQQMHRGVGSQLIYNLQSHQSLFLGALTSNRFLTVLRLHVVGSGSAAHVAAYEVDATGTTELEVENSLKNSSAADRVELRLPVEPDAEMAGERVLFSLSTDYHRQLETYGSLIRQIDHARTSAPPLMGWWSWTAYYFGLNEGAALTNAQWEAEHLKSLGYNVYHVDEGYSYARGEYITPNASLFPQGLESVFYRVHGLGLLPAIWTAPFEVSERSWVYQNHPDWLVKNAEGQPIHAGSVVDGKDPLFVLDTTNPGAQQYLRKTYSTLRNQWGLRFIKMDFMDDSAIEGYYYKPNTTALEAQRIGLQIIREAVGDNFYLDKDGSPMLNTVGLVDYGRISQDTAHTFGATKEAASGMAARYYMNRNFFVSDPDAFTVSEQTIPDQTWHPTVKPATLDDAEVSMALAAVSGGMLEIGDDLPLLAKEPQRLALIENPDMIDIIRLGQSSVPLDLMSFAPEDQQPSIFFLKEDRRQSILTVFNWTDGERNRSIDLKTTGLPATGQYAITDVFSKQKFAPSTAGAVTFSQPAHSVRVLKIIDNDVPAVPPSIVVDHPTTGNTGDTLAFKAQGNDEDAALSWHWDFGDGVTLDGKQVTHAYTQPGDYSVHVTTVGLDGLRAEKDFQIHISGTMPTTFDPPTYKRYASEN